MKNLEKASHNDGDGEKLPGLKLERHKKRLINYYVSRGDERYIFNSNDEKFNEDNATVAGRQWVMDKIGSEPDVFSTLDAKLLLKIKGPIPSLDGKANMNACEEVLESLHDVRQKRILSCIMDEEWDDFSALSGETLQRFVAAYPTPLAFEAMSELFLDKIEQANNPEKRAIYGKAMDGFCQKVYGKKYEYYKAMKSLHEEAAEYQQKKEEHATKVDERRAHAEQTSAHRKGIFGRLGWLGLANLGKSKEKEPLVRDAGIAILNKGDLVGDPERRNEDACYFDQENGVFGVFDGAGGERGAAQASNLASDVMAAMVMRRKPRTAEDMAEILTAANDGLLHDEDAGISTGTIGGIIEERGKKKLIWASVGDSRIYLVRDGKAIQLTQDEGIGNQIWNYLGKENFSVQHMGTEKLRSGDRIVFCSDGITGDYKEDFIPSEEFAAIVERAGSDQLAAEGLIRRATKKDDRTAVVVSV